MPRNRAGMFFTFGWPIIVTVLFGLAFGGNPGADQKPRVVLVDEDQTDGSRAFAARLAGDFTLESMPRDDAANAVRRGQWPAYIVLTKGFGEASERMFYGASREQILDGKALACFVSILAVELILFGVATALGVRAGSLALLALAGLPAAACFVGFMMLIASFGKTEQSASGAAWAVLMPLALVGGAMVPQFAMPGWMQSLGVISPIHWARLAIEGAVWRQFSAAEMATPCLILVTTGMACFAIGTRGLNDA